MSTVTLNRAVTSWHFDVVLPDSHRTADADATIARACLTLLDLSFTPEAASVMFSLSWAVLTAVRVTNRHYNSWD